ncbi:MAG: serine hydrolase domain-containing protein [Microbacterium sp.]
MRAQSRKRQVAVAVATVVALAFGLAGCAPESEVVIDLPPQAEVTLPDEAVEQLQGAVANAMTSSGASGAIVGVWAPWSGSWVTGVGTQFPGSGGEVTPEMQFRAGKITRAMICDVLYAVAAEGTVRLSDSVSEWVASVPGMSKVTLEQLCDSTGGIGAHGPQLMSSWIGNPARSWTPRELASFGLGQSRTEPGAAYRDSDTGYVLLGLVLERATGLSSAQLIDRYVATPLGLDETELRKPSADAVLAGLYSPPVEGGLRDCVTPLDMGALSQSVLYTDSGAVTDIDDLGRYVQALATGALHPGVDDRFSDAKAIVADGPSWFTAAGGAVQAGSLIGQYGSVPGYTTAAFADPKSGLTVAVVLNNSAGAPELGAYLAWELAAIASKAPAAEGATVPEAGLPWTAEQYHAEITARAICAAPPA